eukprot:524831-Prymnesium_polylepis.1
MVQTLPGAAACVLFRFLFLVSTWLWLPPAVVAIAVANEGGRKARGSSTYAANSMLQIPQ